MLTLVFALGTAHAASPCVVLSTLDSAGLEEIAASWTGLAPIRDRIERCPPTAPLDQDQARALHAYLARVAEQEGLPELEARAHRAALGVAPHRWAPVPPGTWVDGVLRPHRPVGQPVLLQQTDERGEVVASTWLIDAPPGSLERATWSTWIPMQSQPVPPEATQTMDWRPRWGGPDTPRATLTAEVRAGWAMGRLENRYTALSWEEEGARRSASWDRLDGGARPVLELGIGVELASWLEVGVLVGLHGWQVVEEAALEADRFEPEDLVVTQRTWIGGMEARSRLRPLTLGPLYPWVLVGLSTRFYGGAPSGWSWTPTIGPGFGLRLGRHLTLQLEVPIGPWGDLDVVSGDSSEALDALRAAEQPSDALWVRAVLGLSLRL